MLNNNNFIHRAPFKTGLQRVPQIIQNNTNPPQPPKATGQTNKVN